MPWQCPICSETHADNFDACWNCTQNPDNKTACSDCDLSTKKLKLSIRTLFVLTLSVAAVLAMFVNEPNDFTILWAFPTYIACWVIPAASIGYDYSNSPDGIWSGIIRGGILCFLSIVLMSAFLPAVQ